MFKLTALKFGEQNPSAGADVVSVLRHVGVTHFLMSNDDFFRVSDEITLTGTTFKKVL